MGKTKTKVDLEDYQTLLDVLSQSYRSVDALNNPAMPRQRVLTSALIWPGQQMHCGACGGRLYRTDKDYLKCQNAFGQSKTPCWNHVRVAAGEVQRRVLPLVFAQVQRTPRIWSMLLAGVAQELSRNPDLGGAAGEDQGVNLVDQRPLATSEPDLVLLARASTAFGMAMRQLILRFVVRCVQPLDCSRVCPRGYVTVCCPNDQLELVETEFVVDLFEPPDHIKYLSTCLEFDRVNPDWAFPRIAEALNLPHLTVKRVFAYARLMKQLSMMTPYHELTSAPSHAARWRQRARRSAGTEVANHGATKGPGVDVVG